MSDHTSPTPVVKTLRLILGDQLNAAHSWYKSKDDNVVYIVAELRQETDYTTHHIQKIAAFFAAMQAFAQALTLAGHDVRHMNLDESAPYRDLPHLLQTLLAEYQCTHFEYQRPDEYRLSQPLEDFCQHLTDAGISHQCVDSEHFLLPFADINREFKAGKHVRMEAFYRRMRKRTGYLMDGDLPAGGQWNFDADNRGSFRKEDILKIPAPLRFQNEVSDIMARIQRHSIAYLGEPTDTLIWPITRRQALQLLSHFCEHNLPNFGRFQDAMTQQSEHSWSLYHARLSFALNSKILHPAQVIQAALTAYQTRPGEINLAQIEGFIRQIIGWREYVRGMYWVNMPHYQTLNHLEAHQALPTWYWNANTKMNCLQKTISQSLKTSYAHHIQRLMITGNFALIAGLNPDEVDAWYLGIYIDAHEWVEIPNTRGMALFADGGLIATKPYAASGNYINKMSDYCKNCHYAVKERIGEKACPMNSLYWDFLARHAERFASNPRMVFAYKGWQRFSETEQQAIRDHAQQLLLRLEQL